MAGVPEDGENRAVSVEHYENFPVASWLCPPALRPPIAAIYHYARTADDIADEGDAPSSARLADLAAYRADLIAVCAGSEPSSRWAGVFAALARSLRERQLPPPLLHDLLDAFEQDVRNPPYPDRAALLDYCRRSADPVGRLLLHLHGIADVASLRRSDAICSALQLINFWQDLGVDVARGRHYVPDADLAAHGLTRADLEAGRDTPATRALVASLCDWAEGLMREGAPLALRVPGRAGWELRLVVQGGLRILEKIRRMDHAALTQRPKIAPADAVALMWRAARMGTRA
ncbi:MAG: squalene synthase HpnC [Burkholderiales bacterium]|nr:squalene synthase HpnC [Burkholderiales bacterium]